MRPLNLSKIQSSLIEEVKVIFKEKFGEDISIPEFEVVQWIESGLKLHKDGDNCKFCEGNLDFSDVKSKIAEFKENKREIERMTQKIEQLHIESSSLGFETNLLNQSSHQLYHYLQ